MPPAQSLNEMFGNIDIYLFDQLLKGHLAPGMRILDAGCGGGRNLVYMLQNGFHVHGVDTSVDSIAAVRELAGRLAPDLPAINFRAEPVDRMSFDDGYFDAVISSAVLHFAAGEKEWHAMVREMWRVLKPGGIFFARLASTIGMETHVQPIEGRRYYLPDGTVRFLVDEAMLRATTESLGGEWLEPLKTVVVANMRSMSTWCLMKS
ncbi:MAG TPA: class I SAM-dependent methyltransferase [Candidatus Kapabacteria bacterium]|nr:class I SAM-dependent methyltransferase [Candidatus Kapabacteria bacterium]